MTEHIMNKVAQKQMVRTKLEILLQRTHLLSRKKECLHIHCVKGKQLTDSRATVP